MAHHKFAPDELVNCLELHLVLLNVKVLQGERKLKKRVSEVVLQNQNYEEHTEQKQHFDKKHESVHFDTFVISCSGNALCIMRLRIFVNLLEHFGFDFDLFQKLI